ncbi:MAG: hypothetical protein HXY49_06290 [Ignavibacteriaceae bacterium]|nr:hypothetical protein [Ignavibacteriaceae bacterium]
MLLLNPRMFFPIFFSFIFVSFAQIDQQLIKEGAPNVFVDCSYCYINYLKEQIPVVNYVRDRKDADVHILISTQRTAASGTEYSLFFIGQNKYHSINDTLKYATNQTDSEESSRIKMVNAIKAGLARYIFNSSAAGKMNISFYSLSEDTTEQKDDWDFWFFRTSINSFLNGQESTNFLDLYGNIAASRVTEDLKLNFNFGSSYYESNFKFADRKIKNVSRYQSFGASVVKAIDKKWSWGIWYSTFRSTYSNIDYSLAIAGGLEYNIFPYSESNQREFRINYKLSTGYNKYISETIFFKLKEQVYVQSAEISFTYIQPWGSISTSLSGATYLHDLSKNELELEGSVSLKLLKGLSFDLYGGYSRIRNQISLPRGGATFEEVLLQRKELDTKYSYWASIGLSYSFGSIYNNIVNPRFGGGGSSTSIIIN